MKRLIAKDDHGYKAKGELEKLIGYLVSRRSGLSLNKEHFDHIKNHFEENGGSMKGLKENAAEDWGQLHDSIDHCMEHHKLK